WRNSGFTLDRLSALPVVGELESQVGLFPSNDAQHQSGPITPLNPEWHSIALPSDRRCSIGPVIPLESTTSQRISAENDIPRRLKIDQSLRGILVKLK